MNDVPIHKRNLGLVFQNLRAVPPHKNGRGRTWPFGLRLSRRAEGRDRVSRGGCARPRAAAQGRRALPQGAVRRPAAAHRPRPRHRESSPTSCCSTSRSRRSTPTCARTCVSSSSGIQDRIGVTTVFVTHDQSEALAMSDEIVVMSNGRVEQVGTPETVYNTPASAFVARFLGASNILPGHLRGARERRGGAGERRLRAHSRARGEGRAARRPGAGDAGDPRREAPPAPPAARRAMGVVARRRTGGDGGLPGPGGALLRACRRPSAPGHQT